MKVLTINIHSHGRDFDPASYRRMLTAFADFVAERKIEAIAIQECCQEHGRPAFAGPLPLRYVPSGDAHAIGEDNCALLLAEELAERGCSYHWTWTGTKLGYGRFNEGLAFFSAAPIVDAESFHISGTQDFSNWKARKALLVTAGGGAQEPPVVFCNVHMGWWQDDEEDFASQMRRLQKALSERGLVTQSKRAQTPVVLLGDFNSPADVRGEGHDMLVELGWKDTYAAAEIRDSGITVPGNIDGWRDGQHEGMRLDYIWTSQDLRVRSSQVVLDGVNGPAVSDHFGVLADIDMHQGPIA